MKGIYTITNKVNNKFYVGSSSNISKRIANHKSRLKNNSHHNEYLQNAYNKNGAESFRFEVIDILENDLTKEDILKIEQSYIDSFNREDLYNLTFITNGGGADSLKKELLLIDLEGNIIKKYESGVDLKKDINCFNYKINTKVKLGYKYRVVTPEFYDLNIETIKLWKPFSSYAPLLKEYKDFLKPLQLTDTHTKEIFIFNTLLEVEAHIKVSAERVRQCLVSGGLISKQYLISKLNKPEDFYAYKFLDL